MEDAYMVQVDTKYKIHMRIEDITENERMASTCIGPSQTRDIESPKTSLAFTGIERGLWKKWIDENYKHKHVSIEITMKKRRMTDKDSRIAAVAKFKHNNHIWNLEIMAWLTPTHTTAT
ncbi:2681_t:CDS:1, partial [Gigaspora rosea]